MLYRLYKVEHALGTFIGVAPDMETALDHFGFKAKIIQIDDEKEILAMRLNGPEKVILAI